MATQTVRIRIGNHTDAVLSRKRFRLIARSALKNLRESSPTIVHTSWYDEMERKRRAVVRDLYGELHNKGDWERTE